MAIIRVNKNKNFTVMSNYHLSDKGLSLKAKGLLSQMLSLPENWDYTIQGLISINMEHERSITSAMNELKERGYLVITKKMPNQTTTGRIEYVYDIYEAPKQAPQKQGVQKQGLQNQGLEFQGLENAGQLNTNKQNTKEQNTKESNTQKSVLDVFESEAMRNAVIKWLQYKREKRQSYTPTGLKELIKRIQAEAAKSGEESVIRDIDYCISQGWSGLFFNKKAKNTAQIDESKTDLDDLF